MHEDRRGALKLIATVSLAATTGPLLAQTPAQGSQSEWLVLYYMNGKNSLAQFALEDFMEMSAVGSSPSVSVVAQLGRPKVGNYTTKPEEYETWSGVKRFLIARSMHPFKKDALMHVGDADAAAGDMGRPESLEDFIEWAVARYPAKRRMLVIWNHGQGWRLKTAGQTTTATSASDAKSGESARTQAFGSFRSVSSDDDHKSILFNKQVQNVLERQKAKGARFDIVAYDACLMSMVETAYSLRNCAEFMVGSQELEPGAGWNHTTFLNKLAADPAMSPQRVSTAVVESYREQYGNFDSTTLAATRLSGIEPAARAIGAAALAIRENAKQSFPELRAVRGQLKGFAEDDGFGFGVDGESLFEMLAAKTANANVRGAAAAAAKSIKDCVIANYASTKVAKQSPRGLAIYYPKSKAEFLRDPDHAGYQRSNHLHPVDFVLDHEWSLLLKDLLNLPG